MEDSIRCQIKYTFIQSIDIWVMSSSRMSLQQNLVYSAKYRQFKEAYTKQLAIAQ